MDVTVFESASWSEPLMNAGVTLLAAALAFFFGRWEYRRQKDREVFQARYLEGGVDRLAGHVEHLLAIGRGNFAHGLRVLRLVRDGGFKDAAESVSLTRFRMPESESMDLAAGLRVHALLQDGAFWMLHNQLLILSEGAATLFADLVSGVKVGEQGRIGETERLTFYNEFLKRAREYESKSHKYHLFAVTLRDLGDYLARRHFGLADLDKIRNDRQVKESVRKIQELAEEQKADDPEGA